MTFTIVIPYYNGQKTITKLVSTIDSSIPILIIDDLSNVRLPKLNRDNVQVIRLGKKGYFTGATNYGLQHTYNDVLVLNQDVYFTNYGWLRQIEEALGKGYSYIGERIKGDRPDWPEGYIHGTFMYLTRELISSIGLMNEVRYPMWGSTAEYQLRAARAGFKVLPLTHINDFVHTRGEESFGDSFKSLLKTEAENRKLFVSTPPVVSVVIPVHGEKYAKFLPSTVNSLVGGPTDLGQWPQQTLASFEVVIVDDSSGDSTPDIIASVCDVWKGVRSIRLDRPHDEVISFVNGKYIGKVVALNAGIEAAYGKYISILDSDDMMEADRLQRLVEAIEKNPHHIVYDNMYTFSEGKRQRLWKLEPEVYDFDKLIYQNHIHNAILFEKSAWKEIGGYPTRFKYGREDWAVNVRFGMYGYCGIHLDYAGLLYRREGHNRTLENTKEKWMQYFQAKMREEYPELYKGVRPMACCGRRSSSSSLLQRNQAFAASIDSTTGMLSEGATLVIYNGSRVGHFSVYGFLTGRQYRVIPGRPFAVDNRDLYSSTPQKTPGILDRYENANFMFSLYEEIAIVEPEPEPEPEQLVQSFSEERFDPSVVDMNVTQLRATLGDFSTEEVTMMLAYELENKNRISAKELLEGRLNA